MFRPSPRTLAFPLVLGLGLAATPALAQVRTFQVDQDRHSQNEVSFTSRAAIVRFTGRTSHVTGDGQVDVQDPSKSPAGRIVVDLKSMDTGVGMRNGHMHHAIEADKYPTATFKMTALRVPALVANQPVDGTVVGTMTFHGVTHPLAAPVTLTWLPQQGHGEYRPGDWVSVSSSFKLKLTDYGIQLPEGILGLKVANDLGVQVDAMARATDVPQAAR